MGTIPHKAYHLCQSAINKSRVSGFMLGTPNYWLMQLKV